MERRGTLLVNALKAEAEAMVAWVVEEALAVVVAVVAAAATSVESLDTLPGNAPAPTSVRIPVETAVVAVVHVTAVGKPATLLGNVPNLTTDEDQEETVENATNVAKLVTLLVSVQSPRKVVML